MKEKTLVKPASLLSLIEADLPEDPCYIYPGILPKGGTMLFGGQAKIGKSFIMLELQRALSTGTQPFGCPLLKIGDPVKTLMIEQELGAFGLQDRVQKIFKDESKAIYGPNAWYASKVPEMQLDSRDGREILQQLVEDIQPNVLFLDPIGRMNSYDENKSDQIQQLFSHLEEILKAYQRHGMSLIVSHHFGKPSKDPKYEGDPLDPYNFRGSSKWFDCPDTLITVAKGKKLDTKHKAWKITVRFETRQAEPPQDMLMTVNELDDRRVRFKNTLGEKIADVKDKKPDGPEMPKKQLRFAEG